MDRMVISVILQRIFLEGILSIDNAAKLGADPLYCNPKALLEDHQKAVHKKNLLKGSY